MQPVFRENYALCWGYKPYVLGHCSSGLSPFELTTPTNVPYSAVALDILYKTNAFLPLRDCSFIAHKGYDMRKIYSAVRERYHVD